MRKSRFNGGVHLTGLIRSGTQQPAVFQANGFYLRTWNAGRIIGINQAGKKTSMITVITKPNGNLVSAFPGLP